LRHEIPRKMNARAFTALTNVVVSVSRTMRKKAELNLPLFLLFIMTNFQLKARVARTKKSSAIARECRAFVSNQL
jgi:hypothetical protein